MFLLCQAPFQVFSYQFYCLVRSLSQRREHARMRKLEPGLYPKVVYEGGKVSKPSLVTLQWTSPSSSLVASDPSRS